MFNNSHTSNVHGGMQNTTLNKSSLNDTMQA